jgi:hypothetical protein
MHAGWKLRQRIFRKSAIRGSGMRIYPHIAPMARIEQQRNQADRNWISAFSL